MISKSGLGYDDDGKNDGLKWKLAELVRRWNNIFTTSPLSSFSKVKNIGRRIRIGSSRIMNQGRWGLIREMTAFLPLVRYRHFVAADEAGTYCRKNPKNLRVTFDKFSGYEIVN